MKDSIYNGRCAAYPGETHETIGLSKRELFAAMAMQGLLAECWHPEMGYSPHREDRDIVRRSVEYADALLAELAKGEGKDDA